MQLALKAVIRISSEISENMLMCIFWWDVVIQLLVQQRAAPATKVFLYLLNDTFIFRVTL